MAVFYSTFSCPHCGMTQTFTLNEHSSGDICCSLSSGGCGKSFKVKTGGYGIVERVTR